MGRTIGLTKALVEERKKKSAEKAKAEKATKAKVEKADDNKEA